jgi:hypothetical protein
MNHFMEKTYRKGEKSKSKKCPECLSDIPAEAKRCAHCSQLIVR